MKVSDVLEQLQRNDSDDDAVVQQKQKQQQPSLAVSHLEGGDAAAIVLLHALSKRQVRELSILHSHLTVSSIKVMNHRNDNGYHNTSIMMNHLQVLYLQDNCLGDDGLEVLARDILPHSHIHTLNVSRNQIGDVGACALLEYNTVDDYDNNNDSSTSTTSCCCLKKLYIYENHIGDLGAEALSLLSQNNNQLAELYCWDNRFGSVGLRHLYKAHRHGLVLKYTWEKKSKPTTLDDKLQQRTVRHPPPIQQAAASVQSQKSIMIDSCVVEVGQSGDVDGVDQEQYQQEEEGQLQHQRQLQADEAVMFTDSDSSAASSTAEPPPLPPAQTANSVLSTTAITSPRNQPPQRLAPSTASRPFDEQQSRLFFERLYRNDDEFANRQKQLPTKPPPSVATNRPFDEPRQLPKTASFASARQVLVQRIESSQHPEEARRATSLKKGNEKPNRPTLLTAATKATNVRESTFSSARSRFEGSFDGAAVSKFERVVPQQERRRHSATPSRLAVPTSNPKQQPLSVSERKLQAAPESFLPRSEDKAQASLFSDTASPLADSSSVSNLRNLFDRSPALQKNQSGRFSWKRRNLQPAPTVPVHGKRLPGNRFGPSPPAPQRPVQPRASSVANLRSVFDRSPPDNGNKKDFDTTQHTATTLDTTGSETQDTVTMEESEHSLLLHDIMGEFLQETSQGVPPSRVSLSVSHLRSQFDKSAGATNRLHPKSTQNHDNDNVGHFRSMPSLLSETDVSSALPTSPNRLRRVLQQSRRWAKPSPQAVPETNAVPTPPWPRDRLQLTSARRLEGLPEKQRQTPSVQANYDQRVVSREVQSFVHTRPKWSRESASQETEAPPLRSPYPGERPPFPRRTFRGRFLPTKQKSPTANRSDLGKPKQATTTSPSSVVTGTSSIFDSLASTSVFDNISGVEEEAQSSPSVRLRAQWFERGSSGGKSKVQRLPQHMSIGEL